MNFAVQVSWMHALIIVMHCSQDQNIRECRCLIFTDSTSSSKDQQYIHEKCMLRMAVCVNGPQVNWTSLFRWAPVRLLCSQPDGTPHPPMWPPQHWWGSPRHPQGRLCWCDRPPAVEEPDWSPGGRTPFPHRRWCPGRPAEQRSSRNRPACCPDTRILLLASPEQQSHWCWSKRERQRR